MSSLVEKYAAQSALPVHLQMAGEACKYRDDETDEIALTAIIESDATDVSVEDRTEDHERKAVITFLRDSTDANFAGVANPLVGEYGGVIEVVATGDVWHLDSVVESNELAVTVNATISSRGRLHGPNVVAQQ